MSGVAADNRFAPPRADVEDQPDIEAGLVEAGRGERFLAVLIDGALPLVLGIIVVVAVAIPFYERYQQEHVPGIEPPALGTRHMSMAWAWLAGLGVLGYFITASRSSTSTARPSASA